jgi:hypothetical protein
MKGSRTGSWRQRIAAPDLRARILFLPPEEVGGADRWDLRMVGWQCWLDREKYDCFDPVFLMDDGFPLVFLTYENLSVDFFTYHILRPSRPLAVLLIEIYTYCKLYYMYALSCLEIGSSLPSEWNGQLLPELEGGQLNHITSCTPVREDANLSRTMREWNGPSPILPKIRKVLYSGNFQGLTKTDMLKMRWTENKYLAN